MTPTEAAALLTIAASFDEPFRLRFWSKVDPTENCWNWLAAKDGYGYGVVSHRGRLYKAHRAAHELFIGPIPDGMLVDHKCHNRACVNPDHLQAVTSRGNLQNRQGANRNNRTSGVRGVSWCSRLQRWVVQVGLDRKRHHGGSYDSIDEAEAAAVALRNRVMVNNLVDRRAS